MVNSFSCQCAAGFTGSTCQVRDFPSSRVATLFCKRYHALPSSRVATMHYAARDTMCYAARDTMCYAARDTMRYAARGAWGGGGGVSVNS